MEQNKREQFIIRRIGGTTYKVRVVFNENGGETMAKHFAPFTTTGTPACMWQTIIIIVSPVGNTET